MYKSDHFFPRTSSSCSQSCFGASPNHPHKTEASSSPSLAQVRDVLFARHGAPEDAAARLAAEVHRLHNIDAFPPFLVEIGASGAVPSARSFTAVLRGTVRTASSAKTAATCRRMQRDKRPIGGRRWQRM
ncbi:hypothetical protein BM221_004351 [Beauveria bassiana]|uniref:Uncharacterized protein n=1 Tax=Beauveria bassiana TaxID=176275 RepID=A0A2N6NR09_BEABA|nr:hypothetical protein BM221_004351 [Beauveria bassiana]